MRSIIYFPNKEYFESVGFSYKNRRYKESASDMLGVTPEQNDIFVIDLHSCKYNFDGIPIAKSLINRIWTIDAEIHLFSWFTKEQLKERDLLPTELIVSKKTKFYQLPLNKE